MRLLELLNALDSEALERLTERHLGPTDEMTHAQVCLDLESELKSPKHVRDAIYNLQPPAFRAMEALLEGEGFSVPLAGFRERIVEGTRQLSEAVSAGAVAGRSQLDLYRRVLIEARRSDLELDASELALLQVLRRELGIRAVEHFLVEHHDEMRQFWETEHAFLDAINGLRSSGLAFAFEGNLVLPEDLVTSVRHVLGIEASSAACRRLFERVSGAVLTEVAQELGLKSSGSKDEKVRRLLDNYVQPSLVLERLGVGELRDLCRDIGLPVSGNKEDLVERLVKAFAADADIRPSEEEPPPPAPEPRKLSRERFEALLLSMRLTDLSDILEGIGSRRVTGTKERLVPLILDSPFSEHTLLSELGNKQLETILHRCGLRTAGSKALRIDRLLQHFAENRDDGRTPAEAPTSFAGTLSDS